MTDAHAHALRLQVAAAALGLDPSSPPSHSAVAWAVAHAVAVECGRKPDDAAEIASRWATIADMAVGSPDDAWPVVPWPHGSPDEPPVFR